MDLRSTDILHRDERSPSGLSSPRIDDKALYRKIDAHILPLMFASYLLQSLDKIVINYANIMGLQEDLGMYGQQFSWVATSFYIAYTAGEFPQGCLLQIFPPAKVLGVNIVIWGILVCSTTACENFASLLAVRTLLGFCESVIGPSLILVTSQWYTRRESIPRYGLWYCGLGASQILGGIISFAAQHGSRTASFSSWRIMFVAVGSFNIVVALLILLLLPKTPDVTPWLNEEEKKHIRERLALDQAGTGRKVFQKKALVEALFFDAQVWILFVLTTLVLIPAGVIANFSAVMIKGFGYDSKSAALLNIPSGAVTIIAILGSTYAVMMEFPRYLCIIVLMVPAVLGAGLMSFYQGGKGGVLAGIYLLNFGTAPLVFIYSLCGTNTHGYTKKVATNAIVGIAHGLGSVIGPQTFLSWEAPRYISAKITLFGVDAAVIGVTVLLRLLYGWRNKERVKERRAELDAISSGCVDPLARDQEGEETDMRNKAFVYIY
ncbi:putative allantoate permease [Xylaria bambusicola]|uniref:putative allantoate permease n=1 Tax=Xylaria bambusicola TaxID=326684 RepID=UPI0020080587|nr:putative allantoate permease [Xylaria bambusicola]KAI0513065.1 putative allantoate permease [Xylaria bambusicola]